MSGIMNMFVAAKTTVATAVDAFFNSVSLLLNTSSTNGAQNNTFLDSSTNNFTITRNGNTTQGTFTPFSQTGWSNYFGSSNSLSVASNAAFAYGTGAITIEFWEWSTTAPTSAVEAWVTNGSNNLNIQRSSGGFYNVYDGTDRVSSTTVVSNQWNHIAFVRQSGGQTNLYVNGTSVLSWTSSVNYGNDTFIIAGSGAFPFPGYISNLRVVKGTAVYTSSFTPSTTPLTAITNTSLLTCQSNRFVDNSASPLTLTINGTPSVQAFSPFAPTAAYSTSVVGGSGYFDGTGDYLATGTASALDNISGDFTIEYWQYPLSGGSAISPVLGTANSGFSGTASFFAFEESLNKLSMYLNATQASSLISYTAPTKLTNNWAHVAWVRSGSVITLYLNGAAAATVTYTSTISLNTTNSNTYVGKNGWDAYHWLGYISNLRIVKGTAVYTSAFTPSTTPLTAITNTQLLLSATNAGIFDSAAKNVLETVGNAQVSTTQAKWGTTSMAFDGTGDVLIIPYSPTIDLGSTTPFTIEFWIYMNSLAARGSVAAKNDGSSAANSQFDLNIETTGQVNVQFYSGGSAITINSATGVITTSSWIYVALTKDASGNYKIFINGTQSGSTTTSTSSINSPVRQLTIGAQTIGGGTSLNGYIDDLRISKYARYTANFTAPTAAFPLQ